ncbi:GNAT family N-acetyltransferase [Neobacillus sp. LXY-1]|uniref:GNAT family N-acetyltransferase n=1 Tax=Neobacillus sp. LXY-1 TaxID=3379133 RepID=UPI003EE24552
MNSIIDNSVTFNDLKWDSEFFGVKSAKANLHRHVASNEWENLKNRFDNYQFISIVNENSVPSNAQLIGKSTTAFLADVNIQFVKKIGSELDLPKEISIHHSLKRNNQVINLANFEFSKFTEDPELAKRGGEKVYHQWIINSFEREEKYFALSKDQNGDINGFLLHSFLDDACVIELIAVSATNKNKGIGAHLFKAVEYAAKEHGSSEIRVGTQLRNIGAINFYHKVGCKQVGCHQIFHLWNL